MVLVLENEFLQNICVDCNLNYIKTIENALHYEKCSIGGRRFALSILKQNNSVLYKLHEH